MTSKEINDMTIKVATPAPTLPRKADVHQKGLQAGNPPVLWTLGASHAGQNPSSIAYRRNFQGL